MVITLMPNQTEFVHNNFVNNLISDVFIKWKLDTNKK